MVESFCSGSVQWAFGTIRCAHPDRPGKMLMLSELIGSIRRRMYLDHMIVFGEAHLRRILHADMPPIIMCPRTLDLLEQGRPPLPRAIERLGAVVSRPVLGGLHHQYSRI